MQLWYPGAEKKPLGTQTEPKIGTPRVLIMHTMSGFLAGSDSWFRRDGYDGTEAHFGVGGSWDQGGRLDGVVWQWQAIDHAADAQYGGNAYATSVETSDGAKSGVPWTAKQLDALIELGTWWCRQTGNPARLVTSAGDRGFGFHSQFPSWNQAGHNCPGAPRVRQLTEEIIPAVAKRLRGDSSKPAKPAEQKPRLLKLTDPLMKGDDVREVQKALNKAGARPKLDADGWYGTQTRGAVKVYQANHGLVADGIVGAKTRAKLGL